VGESTSENSARLVLRNDFQELTRLAGWIEDTVRHCSLPETTSFAVQLCLDEAVANIIMHGSAESKATEIVVTLERQQDEVVLRIEDDGPPFDPTGVAPSLPGPTLESTRIGGLGVHLMRNFSAAMQYQRYANRNCLRLTFRSGPCTEHDEAPHRSMTDDRGDENNRAEATILSLAQSNAVLGRLSPSTLDELLRRGEVLELGANQTLVRQGDASDCAYLILNGALDIQVESNYGEVHLAHIGRGALIGEIGVFADLSRTATVRTQSPVRVMKFDREPLLRAGDSDPVLLRSVIKGLGRQIGTFNHAIGLYTNALSALERRDVDLRILDELLHPIPEIMNFAHSFRRMAEQIVLRRSQHEEMANAATIQRAMLPPAVPFDVLGGRFDIHAEMKPAREVGGDLYDIFSLDRDRLVVTVGDVSGKGVPASLFMAVTQTVMRLVVRDGRDLQSEIETANNLLVANNSEMMFSTLFCGVLELSSGTLTYCNCGHNPPLVVHKADGRCEGLQASSPPLGIENGITYNTQSLVLAPGDLLLLYTDGVTEAEDAAGGQFGINRLERLALETRAGSAGEAVERVMASVAEFSQGVAQFDDITCIALKRSMGDS
jgi:sigma-B regulation protein RsbU (phosphoserine phosphatase)